MKKIVLLLTVLGSLAFIDKVAASSVDLPATKVDTGLLSEVQPNTWHVDCLPGFMCAPAMIFCYDDAEEGGFEEAFGIALDAQLAAIQRC